MKRHAYATRRIIAPDRDRLKRWAAALESRGIPVSMEHRMKRHALIVPARRETDARAEIAAYESDNWNWPKKNATDLRTSQIRPRTMRAQWPIPLAAIFLAFFHGVLIGTGRHDAFVAAGGADNEQIMAGEWQRTLTALTLHADWGHIIANAAWGTVFGLLAALVRGYGVALLFTVVAGAIANFATAAVMAGPRTAIGASTAVMALLGLLTADGFMHRLRTPVPGQTIRGLVLALVGGVAMLSMLGAAPGSDVAGHLLGFLTGLMLGVFANFAKHVWNEKGQLACMTAAILIMVGAWLCA